MNKLTTNTKKTLFNQKKIGVFLQEQKKTVD